jgi:spore cortex biosynthesis protein YabQ
VETVQFQSYIFSYSVYGGILIGILYDIYRALRGRRKRDRLITSLWDVLFLLSVFIVVMWAIFSSSYGDIRAYVFVGFLVGFYLFEKLLGRIMVRIVFFVYRNITSLLKKTNSVLALPVKLLCSFLYHCYNGIVRLLGRGKIKLRKVRKLPKQVIYDSKKYYGLIVKRKKGKVN